MPLQPLPLQRSPSTVPSHCPDDSPARRVDLDIAGARRCWSKVRTEREDQPAAGVRRTRGPHVGQVRVLGFDPVRQRNQCGGGGPALPCLHLYDDLTVGRTSLRRPGLGRDTGRSTRPAPGSDSSAACSRRVPRSSRPSASAGGPGRPGRRCPSCGCSTSPTPGSTHRPGDTQPVGLGSDAFRITVVIASHEADFVESLATRRWWSPGSGDRERVIGRRRHLRWTSGTASPGLGESSTEGRVSAPVLSRPLLTCSRCRPAAARPGGQVPMWRDTVLVAGRTCASRRVPVALSQVAPFGSWPRLFAFALGPDRTLMAKGPRPVLVAVLFCTVLAIQRSVSVESVDGPGTRCASPGWIRRALLGKPQPWRQLVVSRWSRVGSPCSTGQDRTAVAHHRLLRARNHRAGGHRHPLRALSAGLRSKRRCCPSCCCHRRPCPAAAPASGRRHWPAACRRREPVAAAAVVFDAVYLALGVVVYGPIQESA